jgi:hypothetical protein
MIYPNLFKSRYTLKGKDWIKTITAEDRLAFYIGRNLASLYQSYNQTSQRQRYIVGLGRMRINS